MNKNSKFNNMKNWNNIEKNSEVKANNEWTLSISESYC